MRNQKVAAIFAAMADMLAIQGENYHRILAYRRAAENVSTLGRPLDLAGWRGRGDPRHRQDSGVQDR